MENGQVVYAVRSVSDPDKILALVSELKDVADFVRTLLRDPERFVKHTAAYTEGALYWIVYVARPDRIYASDGRSMFLVTEEVLGKKVLAWSGNGTGFIS